MYGFPRHMNTKQDYLNMLKVDPEATRAALRTVFVARLAWLPKKKLADGENPKLTATKQIREIPVDALAGGEGQAERWLYEYKADPQSWFFALGFTAEEAETILQQGDA